ncbi:MAG: hypothetical protein IPG28_05355 [Betaproteobacteria bacterium]|nr:hypothetical protein [Betaproteobacteria bacterium]MBK7082240.1 hypothetical protein [Betaproteobacteria bacterium]MBK8690266.1 hypothetical protein [Betaproteobacteria bacterium]MBK9674330.1 hypothetical protein [Betaproteobacteria bacterium]MBL0291960.1 hypothetical protein [Betaproteobacteria bacterium]
MTVKSASSRGTDGGTAPKFAPALPQLSDFSLVSGGPLYQLLRRTRLSDDELQFTSRRVLVVAMIAWLPLALLSVMEGNGWRSGETLGFLQDMEVHARMLVAIPLFMLAEVWAHRQIPPVIRTFVHDGLVTDATRPSFEAAIDSAIRLRNSVVAELLLVGFVYAVGVAVVWRTQFALDVNTWYAVVDGGLLRPTMAGRWFAWVSMPIFLFLFLRWCFRLFIWTRFLWQVARLDLDLEPTHPDGLAGLHFLVLSERAYRPVLFAMGSVLSGMMANRILYTGAALADFKLEIFAAVVLLLLTVLGPLLVFMPNLRNVRRRGITEYGSIGQRYAREFRRKWIGGGQTTSEPLLGSGDIQSLADLHNAYEVVDKIPMFPFSWRNLTLPTVTVLLPVAPLLLTTFSVEELIDRLLGMLL